MIGVLLTILLMIGISMLAGASEMLEDAFSDPSWIEVKKPTLCNHYQSKVLRDLKG